MVDRHFLVYLNTAGENDRGLIGKWLQGETEEFVNWEKFDKDTLTIGWLRKLQKAGNDLMDSVDRMSGNFVGCEKFVIWAKLT